MDDKSFELISKMYSDMKKQFKEINRKLDEKADKKDIIRLENEFNPKVQALFDDTNRIRTF